MHISVCDACTFYGIACRLRHPSLSMKGYTLSIKLVIEFGLFTFKLSNLIQDILCLLFLGQCHIESQANLAAVSAWAGASLYYLHWAQSSCVKCLAQRVSCRRWRWSWFCFCSIVLSPWNIPQHGVQSSHPSNTRHLISAKFLSHFKLCPHVAHHTSIYEDFFWQMLHGLVLKQGNSNCYFWLSCYRAGESSPRASGAETNCLTVKCDNCEACRISDLL